MTSVWILKPDDINLTGETVEVRTIEDVLTLIPAWPLPASSYTLQTVGARVNMTYGASVQEQATVSLFTDRAQEWVFDTYAKATAHFTLLSLQYLIDR